MRQPKLFDRSTKVLVRTAPSAFLQLAGAQLQGKPVMERNVTVNVPEYQADLVYQIGHDSDPSRWAVHMEAQVRPDSAAMPGWLFKNTALNLQLQMPVLLIVLYLRKGRYTRFPEQVVNKGGPFRNVFQFESVRLWEHADRIRSGELGVLAPLLIMCEDHPTEEVLEQERRLIRSLNVSEGQRAELLSVALSVASAYFSRDRLKEIFREEIPMARGATLVDEWIDEGRIEGLRLGREEGERLGREEGRIQASRDALSTLLVQKFGDLPPLVGQRIEELQDEKRLLELMGRVLNARTLDEVWA